MTAPAGTDNDDKHISIYVVSFNCARTLIDVDFFAAHLLDALPAEQTRPDIVVLSLQELAPIAYSFLGGSLVSQYVHRYEIAVKQAFEDKYGAEAADSIELLAANYVGMTGILVFADHKTTALVGNIQRGGTGVGLWEMGNKGAAGVRLWFRDYGDGEHFAPLSFVAAHLAPMESAWKRRNEDWRSICERLVFTSGIGEASTESSSAPLLREHTPNDGGMLVEGFDLVFAGDLNYRTSDMKPHPDDCHAWPSPLQQTPSDAFSTLFKQDQLNRERKAGHTLNLLEEASIDFPPTYKYSGTAQEAAYSLAKEGTEGSVKDEKLWAGHRFPAWCDRILYYSSANIKTANYTALPIQPTSDHRPVAFSAIVKLHTEAASEQSISPFKMDKKWKSRREQARRLEILVGVAAYLTLTYEGNAILIGTVIGIVGGIIAIHPLLSS